MACTSPRTLWFKQPRKINGHLVRTWPGDCGKCLGCLKKRKSHWSYRIQAEKDTSFSSYFVTLTYDNKHVPLAESGTTHNYGDHKQFIAQLKFHEEPETLEKRSITSNEELLRERAKVKIDREQQKLRYFGVCEYGGETGRTHWHYLLFNIVDIGSINAAWPFGRVHIDECNINTIDYCLKYMLKNEQELQDTDRERSKSFYSKGIGESAANQQFIKFISETENNTLGTSRGSIIGIPRYYRKKFLTDEQRKAKGTAVAEHLEATKKIKDDEIIRMGGNPDKIEVSKNHVKQRQLNQQKKRKL